MLPGGRPRAQACSTAALAGDLSRTSRLGGDIRGRTEWRYDRGDCTLGVNAAFGRTA